MIAEAHESLIVLDAPTLDVATFGGVTFAALVPAAVVGS